jgi:hypothetical protein
MNKFSSPKEEDFLTVCEVVEKMAEMATNTMEARPECNSPFLLDYPPVRALPSFLQNNKMVVGIQSVQSHGFDGNITIER